MKLDVTSRESARRDVIRISQHLAREAGPRTVERFLGALDRVFSRLSSSPLIGAPIESGNPLLSQLRCLSLSARFRNYLVFYTCSANQVDVIRVLHGAQDIDSIMSRRIEAENIDDPDE